MYSFNCDLSAHFHKLYTFNEFRIHKTKKHVSSLNLTQFVFEEPPNEKCFSHINSVAVILFPLRRKKCSCMKKWKYTTLVIFMEIFSKNSYWAPRWRMPSQVRCRSPKIINHTERHYNWFTWWRAGKFCCHRLQYFPDKNSPAWLHLKIMKFLVVTQQPGVPELILM